MRFLLIILAVLTGTAAVAGDPPGSADGGAAGNVQPLSIGWEMLVPERAPLQDPLAGLDMWVQYDLGFVMKVMADAQAQVIQRDSGEYRMAMQVLGSLRASGHDADRMLADLAERDAAIARRKIETNAALDGAVVRVPGYALPLSASAEGVERFLLVPYVGACIHYPPPPPNQVVLATLETPHRFSQRFETVWITGRLSAVSSASGLDYVDGSATVATSWSMSVDRVEPYADDPSAQTDLGSFSPIVEGPKLNLSRRGGVHPLGMSDGN